MNSRPRPIGSGRLSLWLLRQDVAAAACHHGPASDTAVALVSNGLDPVIESAVADAPASIVMRFGRIARFRIDFNRRVVELLSAHPQTDQNTINHLVDDHIAPRIIAAGGLLVLHGSACVIGGRLAVFLGQTGSGKSTLAASLHADGHRLLGDDAVVISEADGGLQGESVYPSLRLYRESIDQVFRQDVGTAAMAFYSDKLHVTADTFGGEGADHFPLGAIYILTERETGVALGQISPADACIALVENSFALDPGDAAAAAQRMAQAARVASVVPCYELAYPYDFALLPQARAQVIASLANPACPA